MSGERELNGCGVSAETFQEIISERKAEKKEQAEEKRLEGLKSILDRKQKTVTTDPLQTFHKEVWESVIETMNKPNDLCNVSQVHDVFSDVPEHRNIQDTLFPQVVGLPILQADPTLCQKARPLARDLNMRAVSKSIMNGVDHWYEDNLHQHVGTGTNVDCTDVPTTWVSLGNSKLMEGLLDTYVGSGSGSEAPRVRRFPQRSLTADFSSPNYPGATESEVKRKYQEACAKFKNDMSSLLEVIGDQVLHFSFIVGSVDSIVKKGGVTFPRIYDTLLDWVKLMPNMKWLELHIGEEWFHPSLRKGGCIMSYLVNHRFPTLEHLVRLDLELNSASFEVLQIYVAVMVTNRHLKRLHINGYHDNILGRLPPSQYLILDSVETFCIGGYDPENCYRWYFIRPFISPKWNLKYIQLNIGGQDVSITEVFQVLQNYETLEHVGLNFTSNIRFSEDLKFLKLSNLTEFELAFDPIIDSPSERNIKFFLSLQFLLCCKKLRKLQWTSRNVMVDHKRLWRFMMDCESENHEGMINFRGGYRNLNGSNVWDVFPYLETIDGYLMERGNWKSRRIEFKRAERDLPSKYEYLKNTQWSWSW